MSLRRVFFHHIPTNEAWARDHGPAFVLRKRRGKTEAAIVDWGFNAWGGKYPPWDADDAVPTRIAEELKLPVFYPGIVMEGGAVDFNGAGTVMTTTSCLLNKNRNPHLRQGYGGQAREEAHREIPARLLRAEARRLARRRHRGRRHRRPHRRSRAVHRRAHDRDRHRDEQARSELRDPAESPPRARQGPRSGRQSLRHRRAADAEAAVIRRPARAGHLRELLFRERRAAGADFGHRDRDRTGDSRSCRSTSRSAK